MPDKPFHVSDVKNSVVVGGSVDGSINNFSRVNPEADYRADDIARLIEELSQLRRSMNQEAKTADESIATSEVAKAEKSLNDNDLPSALKHLKAAGNWALDIATKVGVPIAVEFIKRALAM
jgi:hypothetical protein